MEEKHDQYARRLGLLLTPDDHITDTTLIKLVLTLASEYDRGKRDGAVEARDNALDWLCNCDGFWHVELGGMTFYLEEENNELTKANLEEIQRRFREKELELKGGSEDE